MATPLFDPKTFSPEQAAMLNNVEGQSLSQSNTAAQILAAQNLSRNIPVDQTTGTTELNIKNPDPNLGAEGASLNTYTDYLKLLQTGDQSATSMEADALRDEVGNLLPQTGGRGQAQLDAEAEAGVGTLKNELADVNAQILARTAQYNQLVTNIEGRPITMDSIIGSSAQARKAQASEIGLLQAIALGKQGMLSAAQDSADRAVDLAYDDVESQINIRLEQLKLLEPTLNEEERQRSTALELYLTQEKERVDEQKATAKGFQNDKLDAIVKGMPVAVAQQVQKLFDAGQVEQAYSIMGGYMRRGSGSGSGTFTQSQINKGASTAGISIDDFKRLDDDSKNFFVNNGSAIKQQKTFIDESFDLEESFDDVRAAIEDLDIPDAAKDMFVKYAESKYGIGSTVIDEEVVVEESGDGTPWWKGLVGIGQLGR